MDFLSAKEFAERFGRSAPWAAKLCREGWVAYTHELGRTKRIWIPESEVERYRQRMMEGINYNL